MRKNERIRTLMFKEQISNAEFAALMGVSTGEASIMLKRELSRAEQDEIIAKIKAFIEAEAEGA